MTKRITRFAASFLAAGLAVMGVGGASLSASAATPDPAEFVIASFQGTPGADLFNATAGGAEGAWFVVEGLTPGDTVSGTYSVATAAAPTVFGTPVPLVDSTLPTPGTVPPSGVSTFTVNGAFQPSTTNPVAVGDIIKVTVNHDGGASEVVDYTIPSLTAGEFIYPEVAVPGTYTSAQALAGVTANITNLDPTKPIIIETSVRLPAVAGQPENEFIVIDRQFVNPSEFTGTTYTTVVSASSPTDDQAPLGELGFVNFTVNSGAGIGNEGSGGVAISADDVTVPDVIAGAFVTPNPTAVQLLEGAEYRITGLDNTKSNVSQVLVARAATPTEFTIVSTTPISSSSIVDGVALNEISVYYQATPNNLPLNAGDIVQVKVIVDGEAGFVLTNYTIPSSTVDPPVDPSAPAGAFTPATPSAADFVKGANFTITNLDPAATNVTNIYAKAPNGDFVLLDTFTIPTADIVDGSYVLVVQAFLSADGGVTKTPLADGTTVRVGLVVGSENEVVLADYVIKAATGGTTPGGDNKLAETGLSDERALQGILGTLAAVSILGAIALLVLVRSRKRHEAGAHVA